VSLTFLNAVSDYRKTPNRLIRGLGMHSFSYAIVPHRGSFEQAGIPRQAYEFNSPPLMQASTQLSNPTSLLETSENVIVEAVRRVGKQVEVRFSEWRGQSGEAEIALNLPHRNAALTNMMGEKPVALAGGVRYRFPIRPQQIVTLRFDVDSAVEEPAPVLSWSRLVPPEKRKSLDIRTGAKGHPMRQKQ
jgi:alpha-mannosidase